MDMERFAYITIVILASLNLGFIFGKAYVKRKMKKLTRQIQILENYKHAVKVLCPKIKSGDDMADYLPEKINGEIIVAPFEDFDKPIKNIEDEDTETGELKIEKVTKGDPHDA